MKSAGTNQALVLVDAAPGGQGSSQFSARNSSNQSMPANNSLILGFQRPPIASTHGQAQPDTKTRPGRRDGSTAELLASKDRSTWWQPPSPGLGVAVGPKLLIKHRGSMEEGRPQHEPRTAEPRPPGATADKAISKRFVWSSRRGQAVSQPDASLALSFKTGGKLATKSKLLVCEWAEGCTKPPNQLMRHRGVEPVDHDYHGAKT